MMLVWVERVVQTSVYVCICLCFVLFFHCVVSTDELCCSVPPVCPAADSVVVLQEGAGLPAAHTPSDWLESEEFGPATSDPIFMAADAKTPPPGTLSRVGCCSAGFKFIFHCCFVLLICLANSFQISIHPI